MFLAMSFNLDSKLIESSLSTYRPKRKFLRHLGKRSSVAIILRQKAENHEVLIEFPKASLIIRFFSKLTTDVSLIQSVDCAEVNLLIVSIFFEI